MALHNSPQFPFPQTGSEVSVSCLGVEVWSRGSRIGVRERGCWETEACCASPLSLIYGKLLHCFCCLVTSWSLVVQMGRFKLFIYLCTPSFDTALSDSFLLSVSLWWRKGGSGRPVQFHPQLWWWLWGGVWCGLLNGQNTEPAPLDRSPNCSPVVWSHLYLWWCIHSQTESFSLGRHWFARQTKDVDSMSAPPGRKVLQGSPHESVGKASWLFFLLFIHPAVLL